MNARVFLIMAPGMTLMTLIFALNLDPTRAEMWSGIGILTAAAAFEVAYMK